MKQNVDSGGLCNDEKHDTKHSENRASLLVEGQQDKSLTKSSIAYEEQDWQLRLVAQTLRLGQQ